VKVPYAGTIYNVAGSSSANQSGVNPFNERHPMMPFSYFSDGSLLITVNGGKLEAEFVMRDGKILDRYSIEKAAGFCR